MPGDGEWFVRHMTEITYEYSEKETPYLVNKPTDKPGQVCFVAYCKKCHKGLCKGLVVGQAHMKQENIILVEPCEYCLEQARKDAKGGVGS